jgi:hypothetical protein
MNIKITINTENAAFEDQESQETARILQDLTKRINGHPHFSPGHSQPLRDINGNKVGSFDIYK